MYNNLALAFIKVRTILRNNKGQSMTEYGIIIGLIAVVLIGVITALSDKIREVFQLVIDALTTG